MRSRRAFHTNTETAQLAVGLRLRRLINTLSTLLVTMVSPLLLCCHSGGRKWIAVIPETTAQELWEAEHAGVERAARASGAQIYWNAPSREDDIPRQVEIVERAVQARVGGLILSPDHAVALIPAVRSALREGIPTVILGSSLQVSATPKLFFVQNDENAAGQLAAERAAKYLRSRDSVAVLGVDPNLPTTLHFADAFETALRQLRPGVTIVERRNTSFSFPEAEAAAEEVIRSTPSLKVMVGLTINQTRGAYQALQNDHAPNTIKLIGVDQDLDLVHHLRSGGIDAIIAKNTADMGAIAVHMIEASRAGMPTADRAIVEPRLVTRDNVDTPEIQQILNMDWRGQ